MRTLIFKTNPVELIGELTEDIPIMEGSLVRIEKKLYEVLMETWELTRTGRLIDAIRNIYLVEAIITQDILIKKGVIEYDG